MPTERNVVLYKGQPQRVYYTVPFTFKNPCEAAPSSATPGAGNQGGL